VVEAAFVVAGVAVAVGIVGAIGAVGLGLCTVVVGCKMAALVVGLDCMGTLAKLIALRVGVVEVLSRNEDYCLSELLHIEECCFSVEHEVDRYAPVV